ncbi:hypothetical protein Tco_0761366 [Tanacetum coccineum]
METSLECPILEDVEETIAREEVELGISPPNTELDEVEVFNGQTVFRTELQEKIASHRLVIEHLEKVGATSGWVMHLKRDQEDDVSLLGLLDTFVHTMYEIVRKREKDLANASLQMQAANACCKWLLQMLACKCKLQMQAADACCKCKLHMQAANDCLQMLTCKCLLGNACMQMQNQAANFR